VEIFRLLRGRLRGLLPESRQHQGKPRQNPVSEFHGVTFVAHGARLLLVDLVDALKNFPQNTYGKSSEPATILAP
jgi:hypothetical protein